MELTRPTAEAGGSTRFWRYWTARSVSATGSSIGALAMTLTAITVLHADSFEVGLLVAAEYAAWLVLSLPLGAVVHRLPLRGAQVAADLVRAAALAWVVVAWAVGVLTIGDLVLVAVAVGIATVVFDLCSQTYLPRIVPTTELQKRNSINSGTEAVTQLGGPSLGAVLVKVLGAVPTVLVDAVSYVVSAAFLAMLPATRPEPDPDRVRILGGIGEGWRYVTRHPVVGPAMWAATALNLVCGAQAALHSLYLVRTLHVPIALIGALLATEGVGSLIGAAAATRLASRFGTARCCLLAALLAPLGAMLVPIGAGWVAVALFAIGNLTFATGVVIVSITTRTYRQVTTPARLLPRVIATVRFVSWGALPLGGLAAGVVALPLGYRASLLLLVPVSLLAPAVLLAAKAFRGRDLDPSAAAPPTTAAPGAAGFEPA